MSKAIVRESLSFDAMPLDSQLVCLLGDDAFGPIQLYESDGIVAVRPQLIPMRFIATLMVFVAIGITGMMCFARLYRDQKLFFWLALFTLWFLALPALLGVTIAINRWSMRKGDWFKFDLARQTLELCRLGRTVKSRDIAAITLLVRWYRKAAGSWFQTRQTGVLVRTANGRFELYPLVRELAENVPIFNKSLADRLANIFQVPLRRIELTRSESRALSDC